MVTCCNSKKSLQMLGSDVGSGAGYFTINNKFKFYLDVSRTSEFSVGQHFRVKLDRTPTPPPRTQHWSSDSSSPPPSSLSSPSSCSKGCVVVDTFSNKHHNAHLSQHSQILVPFPHYLKGASRYDVSMAPSSPSHVEIISGSSLTSSS